MTAADGREDPTMTRLHTLGFFCAALALPACIIDTGLGETAEDDGSAGGSESGGDTADPDPSATSGQPPTGTTGDSSGEGDVTTDPTDPTDTEGDTEGEPGCEQGEDWVIWADDFFEPIPGIEASTAILEGPCTLDGTFSGSPDGVSYEWEIYLTCTMSGRVDGDPDVVDQPFSPVLHGFSASPLEQWLPFFETDLRLRLVLDWWGMGYSRYAVLHRGDDVMLDLVQAEYVDPLDGPFWQEELSALLGDEPWHDGIYVGVTESTCDTELGKCGEDPRAIELDWEVAGGGIFLHDGQQGSFGTTVPELMYQAWVEAAADISTPTCTDTPLGDYRFSLWAVEP